MPASCLCSPHTHRGHAQVAPASTERLGPELASSRASPRRLLRPLLLAPASRCGERAWSPATAPVRAFGGGELSGCSRHPEHCERSSPRPHPSAWLGLLQSAPT